MSLVEAVKQAEQETRTKLLEKYRELLNRNDSGDVKALRQVMDKLGIAADRLERDLSTVQRAAQLEAEAAKADDPALDAAKNAASKAYSDYREESERISREPQSRGRSAVPGIAYAMRPTKQRVYRSNSPERAAGQTPGPLRLGRAQAGATEAGRNHGSPVS